MRDTGAKDTGREDAGARTDTYEPGTAERADDRDGLRLDRLRLPLGPALPDWPAGLVLRVALQGDIVQSAEADPLPVRHAVRPFWNEPWLRAADGAAVTRGAAARRRCAAHLDSTGRFLAVAGWDGPAGVARRLRDAVLAGAPAGAVRRPVRSLARRVGRSRTLRALTAGLGPLPARAAEAAGVTGPALRADGDSHDRLLTWLAETEEAVDRLEDQRPIGPGGMEGPRGRLDGPLPPSRPLLDVLPELLAGAEFAGARIIVAGLDPDIGELAPVPGRGAAHV